MTAWIIEHVFSSLTGWLGITGVVVVVCGLVAWFFPPFRRLAIEIGAVALAAATIYTKGNRDEAKKWNDAIDRDVAAGNKARSDAERDVNSGVVRGGEWDRDKGGV